MNTLIATICLLHSLLFFFVVADEEQLFATLNLHDPRTNTSRCIDSLPLDTCLFGTKYSLTTRSDQSGKKNKNKNKNSYSFVNISIFRHFSGHDCQHEHKKARIDHAHGRQSLTIPVGVRFSLREFLANQQREMVAHRVGAFDYMKKGDRGHRLADTSDYFELRNFGRPLISSGTLFGAEKTDEDSILIEGCDTDKGEHCSFQTFTSRDRSSSRAPEQHSTIKSLSFISDDVNHDNLHYEFGGQKFYCVAMTSPVFPASSLQSDLIMKEIYSSNEECLSFSSVSKQENKMIWQMIPVDNNNNGIIKKEDNYLYSTVFVEGQLRPIRGNQLLIVSSSSSSDHDASTCLQSSYLTSLQIRSCAVIREDESVIARSSNRKNQAAAGGTATTTLRRQNEYEFFSNRWSGSFPTHAISSSPRANRQLNYELDGICRPATCVSFLVFEHRDECHSMTPNDNSKLSIHQSDLKDKAKVLTLQCGTYHDRDSTAGLLHNVFLWCNDEMNQFYLYSECNGAWCKKQFSSPSSLSSSSKKTSSTCVPLEPHFFVNPEKNQGKIHSYDEGDQHFYLSLLETGSECSTFGINVIRQKEFLSNTHSVVAMDNDRFVSGTCIPTAANEEPRVAPHCVDWKSGSSSSTSSSTSSTTSSFINLRKMSLHVILDTYVVSQEEFPKKLWQMIHGSTTSSSSSNALDASFSVVTLQEHHHSNSRHSSSIFPNSDEFIFSEFRHPDPSAAPRTSSDRKQIKISNFANPNDLAALNSLTQEQYRSLGIISVAFDEVASVSFSSSSWADSVENLFRQADNNELDSFVIPKSFRKGEVDFSNDEMTNAQGPITVSSRDDTTKKKKKKKLHHYKRKFIADTVGDEREENRKKKKKEEHDNDSTELAQAKFVRDMWIMMSGVLVISVAFWCYRRRNSNMKKVKL